MLWYHRLCHDIEGNKNILVILNFITIEDSSSEGETNGSVRKIQTSLAYKTIVGLWQLNCIAVWSSYFYTEIYA